MATKTEREKIRKDHPDSWIAVEEGDTISGKVVDVTEAWSDQRQNGSWYPLLTLDLKDGEVTGYSHEVVELKVHCFGAVLYNEVMRHKPEVGETIRITYKGTGEAKKRDQNPPELYSLRVEGRTDQAQRAYGRIEASQPTSGVTQARSTGTAEAPEPEQPELSATDGDEDIPF